MADPSNSNLDPASNVSPNTYPAGSKLRQELFDATKLATGWDPFDWQLNVAEALCKRRDVLCIAGTGSGKTLPFVMPTFVDPKALVWIVSPLNYIEQQQQKTFSDWNVKAFAVNATTSYLGLRSDILAGKYRVIITSPEQLLEYNKLRPIIIQLGAQNWNNIVIVDECHCICIWSEQFRRMYGLLGSIRTFLCPGTPFCAATATATRSMQKQILSLLRYTSDYLFENRGYWKSNLSWHTYYMKGADASLGEITYMFPRGIKVKSDIPTTLIFVDQRGLAFELFRILRKFLPGV
ncbi:DEAD/DEAH box helicase [Ceratobasidium sp. AG-Ba]|nr:DEAD/DEAH box helicase [Ceratobasidium sp. AG-Ba]